MVPCIQHRLRDRGAGVGPTWPGPLSPVFLRPWIATALPVTTVVARGAVNDDMLPPGDTLPAHETAARFARERLSHRRYPNMPGSFGRLPTRIASLPATTVVVCGINEGLSPDAQLRLCCPFKLLHAWENPIPVPGNSQATQSREARVRWVV
jgi:hypothetical protein